LNSVHRIESEAAAATQDPMGFAQHPHWIGHVTEYYTATEDRVERAASKRQTRGVRNEKLHKVAILTVSRLLNHFHREVRGH